ncbi:Glu/Leu/Phe/Val dehydrogenase dimerization domain-containing protein [Desertimonas flava]|uniref:Glu/Leu/Phe/Val dehydrogenase dimerization domain-containing protein n=1 Tax=Desertimonas flava TaxID=2064846 RepID=UPI000E355B3C|nr:Glu/Leu/Phe/Val dehydrogenase dimerization domain-containing protein [Desertimonas flava]
MIFGDEHEQVVFAQDPTCGLRTVVAVYSTALGPALGGTRFYPYPDETTAVADVLALSKAMAYKNAMAGLPHGGGKAVIVGDPATDKTPDLLRAYGRVVESLGGRYVTACDVGMYVADMDVVAETSQYVTGRSEAAGGAGDSSVLTAYGLHRAMLAAAQFCWGADGLAGRRVGVVGVGKVGRHLVDLLVAGGAEVVATDVASSARESVAGRHPRVEWLDDAEAVMTADVDIVAPCALGGAIHAGNIDRIVAPVVCGAANNQLADDGLAERLAARGVTYCPDYVVNAGGVIQVADERNGFQFARAEAKTAVIYDTTLEVLSTARAEGITPLAAADRIAEARMRAARRR